MRAHNAELISVSQPLSIYQIATQRPFGKMSTPVDREMPEDPPDAMQSALYHDGLGIEDFPALELLRQVNPAVAAIMSDRLFQNITAYAYGDYAVTRNSGD